MFIYTTQRNKSLPFTLYQSYLLSVVISDHPLASRRWDDGWWHPLTKYFVPHWRSVPSGELRLHQPLAPQQLAALNDLDTCRTLSARYYINKHTKKQQQSVSQENQHIASQNNFNSSQKTFQSGVGGIQLSYWYECVACRSEKRGLENWLLPNFGSQRTDFFVHFKALKTKTCKYEGPPPLFKSRVMFTLTGLI